MREAWTLEVILAINLEKLHVILYKLGYIVLSKENVESSAMITSVQLQIYSCIQRILLQILEYSSQNKSIISMNRQQDLLKHSRQSNIG